MKLGEFNQIYYIAKGDDESSIRVCNFAVSPVES